MDRAVTHPNDMPASSVADARHAGAILVAASLLSLLIMSHHPSGSTHDMAAFVERIGRVGALNRGVHGALIALLGVLLFAFAEFTRTFGRGRPLLRLALLAYAIGVGADIGAAMINGFTIGTLATRYAGADATALESLRQLMHLCRAMNQALAGIGEVARAVAIALWSAAILRGGAARGLGATGLAIGTGIAIALLGGWLVLDVHGMLLSVLLGTAWTVALGVQLLRGRVFDASATARDG